VRLVDLPATGMQKFGSVGIVATALARVEEDVEGFGVDVATYAAGSLNGRHPTRLWQLFAVVSGAGWAEGADGERVELTVGDAVLWEPGEEHASGSDAGMVAVIVQSPVSPVEAA
jgi:quercetin dioxygenase-like cupin family protein